MTTKQVADRLVALCRAGRNVEAAETLLSTDVVSVEAQGDETMPAVMKGRDAIRGKNAWWIENHTIHNSSVKGPYPNGERFAVIFDFEVTPKVGPMAGKRMRMEEVALYTVGDGKITREEFFYDMGGASNLPVSKTKKQAPPKKAAAKTKTAKPKRAAKKTAAEAKRKGKGRRR